MFCSNCGKAVNGKAKFCENCGSPLTQAEPAQQPAQQPVQQPAQTQQAAQATVNEKPKKKGKVGGIIMLVLGGLAALGMATNGTLENMLEYGMDMSDFFAVALDGGLIIGGLCMLTKDKKES